MAAFSYNVDDFSRLMLDLDALADDMDEYIPEMLNAGADILVEAQKITAKAYKVEDTGQMIASIGKSEVKTSKNSGWWLGDKGGRHINIYPMGSRERDGITTTNAEIAFVNEFGTGKQIARPFMLAANESFGEKAVDAMENIYDKYLISKNL